MAAYTLQEIAEERAATKEAIRKALLAQEYRSGDNGATRARLQELRDHLAFLDAEEAKLSGGGFVLGVLRTEVVR
ncbi:MAG: hypothetical protein KQJ78_14730 [Deltaproteobacteria bacterium]|nr:hypothetical protein [Deltaproteobacteria bacterium]